MNHCDKKLGPRVVSVIPTDDFQLILTFTNGEKKLFNAQILFSMPVFKSLKNIQIFKSVTVKHGTVVWQNDIDLCPDTLYMESLNFD